MNPINPSKFDSSMKSALLEFKGARYSHPYPFLVRNKIDSASDLDSDGVGAIKKSMKVGEEESVEGCWVPM